MKRLYTLLYMLVLCLGASAQKVNLSLKDTPLADALRQIDQGQKEWHVHFVFDELEDFRVTKVIRRQSAQSAVQTICKGLPVRVETKGSDIFVESIANRTLHLTGSVEDAFLGIGLPQARVTIFTTDSTVVLDSAQSVGMVITNQAHHFFAPVPAVKRDYLVRATQKGYTEAWERVSVKDPTAKEVTIPTLKLRRMMERNLDEVTVTATRIKMFYRGDTLVYDATAFKLPEGSMLDDLIRQLDGVTMNDAGEIFVNGRKVDELLLGSRSFFRGNRKVLLENLPYYTVKEIKVYEKQSDMSRALGYEVGPRTYVMDVCLKDEYHNGYIANVEAAGGTHQRWLGRAFLLKFTDRWRYTLLGNANNVNQEHHIGKEDHWTPSTQMRQCMLTTRRVGAEASYESKDKNRRNTLTADYSFLTSQTDMQRRTETFLAGMTPHSTTQQAQRNDAHSVSLSNRFLLLKPGYINIGADLRHETSDGHSQESFRQWADTLVTHMLTSDMDRQHRTSGSLSGMFRFSVNKERQQDLFITASTDYSRDRTERAQRFEQTALPTTHNTNDSESRHRQAKAYVKYSQPLLGLRLGAGVEYKYEDTRAHDRLYHPDTLTLPSQRDALAATLDARNSYDEFYSRQQGVIDLSLTKHVYWELAPGYTIYGERWQVGLKMPLLQQRLDYQRGAVDTLAQQTTLHLNPYVSYNYHLTKKGVPHNTFKVTAEFSTHDLDLMQAIPFRDDSRPLVTRLGNSHLLPRQVSSCTFNYQNQHGPGGRMVNVESRLGYFHRDIAQSVRFQPLTGAYTYQPVNVRGATRWLNTLGYSRTLDRGKRWSLSSTATANLIHALDHTMLEGETQSRVNRVRTFTLGEKFYAQYSRDALCIRATGDILWRRSHGRMQDFQTLSVIDYQYGANARYTLPRLKMTVSAEGIMYSRRGYGSSALNTDDFVLNASLSQPFLKSKLIARIEAFDLLHQLPATHYEVSALGRTETAFRSLPHYVMAHVVYHWNRNPKKEVKK